MGAPLSATADRALVVAGLAGLVAVAVLGGRLLARSRLRQLQERRAAALWAALCVGPDGRATVVAFSTPTCAACRAAQRPALAALEERADDRVRVIHVDASERPDVASLFGVLTVPATMVLDEHGAVIAANQGFATTEKLAVQLGLRSP